MHEPAPRLITFGHRGARGHAPENTLTAIETGLALGAEWIEIDVRRVDDSLFVIHDEDLSRTTNGTGSIYDRTPDDLRTLDAGDGRPIPRLEDVLDLVDGRAGVNVELKDAPAGPRAVDALRARLDAGWPASRLLLSCFDVSWLADARRRASEIPRGLLADRRRPTLVRDALAVGAVALHPALEIVDAALVADAHEAGLRVYVFTVNDPDEIAGMAALGVDGVFTDYPDRVAAWNAG